MEETQSSITILAIVGSLRKGSYNLQLAKQAQRVISANDSCVAFNILEWADTPLFNEDIEHPAPDSISRVRKQVRAADGIWIFTAEYNHFFPGVLKNLIDWLSRPISEDHGNVLKGKAIALSGASIGMHGTSHAQDHLTTLLSYLDTNIMNSPRLIIPHVKEQSHDGILTLTTSLPYLEKQSQAFISFIKAKRK